MSMASANKKASLLGALPNRALKKSKLEEEALGLGAPLLAQVQDTRSGTQQTKEEKEAEKRQKQEAKKRAKEEAKRKKDEEKKKKKEEREKKKDEKLEEKGLLPPSEEELRQEAAAEARRLAMKSGFMSTVVSRAMGLRSNRSLLGK